jgi:hypothetical protein
LRAWGLVRTDSPAEEDGFEPSVPLGREVLERSNISTRWVLLHGGTEGSNPSSSSEESAANPESLDQAVLISGASRPVIAQSRGVVRSRVDKP